MGAILQYGLSVALVGMSTVFVGLIILIGLIKLMEMIMTGGKGKKKAEAPAPAAAPAPVAEEAVEETDDDELMPSSPLPLQPRWNRRARKTRRGLSCAPSAASTTRPRGTAPDARSRFTAACNRRCFTEHSILRGGSPLCVILLSP